MPKIKELYAYIAEEIKSDEGIVGATAIIGGQYGMLPLVAADRERVESLRPLVHRIANQTRKRITLVKFSVREDLETIEPGYIPLKG